MKSKRTVLRLQAEAAWRARAGADQSVVAPARITTLAQSLRRGREIVLVCAAGLVALSIAACGSSSGGTPSTSSGAAPTTSGAATSSGASASGGGGGANLAAAKAVVATYTGHPSPFPASKPLGKQLPPGTKIAYLQCSAPICGVAKQILAGAVHLLGAQLISINAGATASSSQAAASSALALKPAAVLVTGVDPSLFAGGLKKLSAAGIKVVSVSVAEPDPKQYGITFNYLGRSSSLAEGKAMADWVIVNKGPKADIVFYGIPEATITAPIYQAFKQELTKNCSSCKLREVPIDITAAGTTAPQTIVTDLQSHSSTNTAVFAGAETAEGLPAALKSAGINITMIGGTPEPAELQYIKDGQMTAGFADSIASNLFTQVDVAARLILGEAPTPAEVAGNGVVQILEQKDITFNPALGYVGYPDFAQRFAKLWHAKP